MATRRGRGEEIKSSSVIPSESSGVTKATSRLPVPALSSMTSHPTFGHESSANYWRPHDFQYLQSCHCAVVLDKLYLMKQPDQSRRAHTQRYCYLGSASFCSPHTMNPSRPLKRCQHRASLVVFMFVPAARPGDGFGDSRETASNLKPK